MLLTPIVHREQTSLKALAHKSFAVDGNIELHQFLALIRKRDGTLFTSKEGRVTSHLIGLLTRTARLIIDYHMDLVFVFDGRFNPLKRATVEERRRVREKAQQEFVQALKTGDQPKAWSKAVMTGRVTGDILGDSKRLLTIMGVPWLVASEDAEAQASYMASKGDVWAVGGKDYDSLLFGTPRLVRYLTITGTEYLPTQHRSRKLLPEVISLETNLRGMGITREQLIDLAILVGTDFGPGVKGIGPKKALALVRQFGTIERMPEKVNADLMDNLTEVREVFLKPKTLDDYSLHQSRPNIAELIEFLVEERGFGRERIEQVTHNLVKAYDEHQDMTLGGWME